jgi:hypothetical protein
MFGSGRVRGSRGGGPCVTGQRAVTERDGCEGRGGRGGRGSRCTGARARVLTDDRAAGAPMASEALSAGINGGSLSSQHDRDQQTQAVKALHLHLCQNPRVAWAGCTAACVEGMCSSRHRHRHARGGLAASAHCWAHAVSSTSRSARILSCTVLSSTWGLLCAAAAAAAARRHRCALKLHCRRYRRNPHRYVMPFLQCPHLVPVCRHAPAMPLGAIIIPPLGAFFLFRPLVHLSFPRQSHLL